jgi:hypothetical protein
MLKDTDHGAVLKPEPLKSSIIRGVVITSLNGPRRGRAKKKAIEAVRLPSQEPVRWLLLVVLTLSVYVHLDQFDSGLESRTRNDHLKAAMLWMVVMLMREV